MRVEWLGCKILFVDNDKIVEDFFRGLRVALTNAFSYPKDHPYFIKSVESFKLKLESLLAVFNPFKIGVTDSGIVSGGKNLTGSNLYDELARLLHQRKIKSIEIREGFGLQELTRFLCLISLPQNDIFKSGGLSALLEKEGLTHFSVSELDYSAFLQAEGKECGDVWGYMLKDAVNSDDPAKMEQLADSFGSMIKRVNQKELFDKQGVYSQVNEFLAGLRSKNKEKFDKCLNDVFLWLLRNKKTVSPEDLQKLEPAFAGLGQDEFSSLLKEGFLQEDNFDSLSLQLFSKISEQGDSRKITKNFFNQINQANDLKDNPVVLKKMWNLLSGPQDELMSAVYRNTLDSLVKNISFSGKLIFDHKQLKQNYRYIILGILSSDKNPDTLRMSASILEKELAGIFEDNDTGLLKDLQDVLNKRGKEGIKACIDLERQAALFVETAALKGSLAPEQEFLLDMVSSASEGPNVYLDNIFSSGKINPQVLKLFLRLFPADFEAFYARIGQKIQDTEFLVSLIEALGQVNLVSARGILEYIYSRANELVKIESLEAMRKLEKADTSFLLRQLNTDSFSLREQVVSLLILDPKARDSILELLFKFPSFMGSKNELLIENMKIAFDLHFVEAQACIKELSRRRFFWNRKLRDKAIQILRGWDID